MQEAQLCGFAVAFGATVEAFSNAGPIQKSSVFCGLGCIEAAELLLILVLALTKKQKFQISSLWVFGKHLGVML